MNYTEIFKIFKELVLKYGLWKTAMAVSLTMALPIFVWQLANILNAVAALLAVLR